MQGTKQKSYQFYEANISLTSKPHRDHTHAPHTAPKHCSPPHVHHTHIAQIHTNIPHTLYVRWKRAQLWFVASSQKRSTDTGLTQGNFILRRRFTSARGKGKKEKEKHGTWFLSDIGISQTERNQLRRRILTD